MLPDSPSPPFINTVFNLEEEKVIFGNTGRAKVATAGRHEGKY